MMRVTDPIRRSAIAFTVSMIAAAGGVAVAQDDRQPDLRRIDALLADSEARHESPPIARNHQITLTVQAIRADAGPGNFTFTHDIKDIIYIAAFLHTPNSHKPQFEAALPIQGMVTSRRLATGTYDIVVYDFRGMAAGRWSRIAIDNAGSGFAVAAHAVAEGADISRLRRASAEGDAGADYQLGVAYRDGVGVAADPPRAADYLLTSAILAWDFSFSHGSKGADDAQEYESEYRSVAARLGPAELVDSITGAAASIPNLAREGNISERGIALAAFDFGQAYATGTGIARDDVEAYMWLTIAAARGTGDSQKKYAEARDAIAKRLNKNQITDAQKRAREWMDSLVEK